jgi:hypothetical protein
LDYPKQLKDDCMPPWGHSDMEALKYTDEELDAMCAAATSAKKGKVGMLTHQEAIDAGWEMTDDGIWMSPQKKDKVKKWILPVDDDYNITFPEDLLEQTGWKEGDTLQWIDQGDGSFKMIKEGN